MMTYVWAAVIISALLLEGVTLALVAIWLVPGAICALVMSLLSVSMTWQVLAFACITVITMVLGLSIRKKKAKTNVDSVVGQTVLITEEVDNIKGQGAGKLGGLVWSVRAASEKEQLLPGDQAEIVEVQGVKLICRKK